MHYTTTTTADKNLPSTRESEFDTQGLIYLVCELFGVTRADMCSRTRKKEVKFARWVVWKFCTEKGNMTLRDAGKVFSGCKYDHSTVVNSRIKLPQDIAQFEWLRVIVDKVEAEMSPQKEVVCAQ